METMEAIRTRRSVRKFTGEPISRSQLQTLLEAAMYAPSAHDRRPWEFVTVTRPETLADLAEKGRWWKMLPQAGTGILVCADMNKGEKIVPEMHLNGCSAAIQYSYAATDADAWFIQHRGGEDFRYSGPLRGLAARCRPDFGRRTAARHRDGDGCHGRWRCILGQVCPLM